MSLMRPDMMAGPMLRKARPASNPSLRSGVLAAAGAGLAFGFGAGVWPAASPAIEPDMIRIMAIDAHIFFMGTS